MTGLLAHASASNIHLCVSVLAQFGVQSEERSCATPFHGSKRPFYPSVITRDHQLDDATNSHIQSLPRGAGVKDSFSTLDLTDQGFSPVMSAQWIARRGHTPEPVPFQTVTNASLDEWRKAWGDDARGHSNFTASLLAMPGLKLRHSANMAAGLITNCYAAGVTGVSNILGDPSYVLAGLGDVPETDLLVGYESDPSPFLELRLEPLDPLTIWIKTG